MEEGRKGGVGVAGVFNFLRFWDVHKLAIIQQKN
jgi:hypothetical protein